MEIGRIVFILNKGLIASPGDNHQDTKLECRVQSFGFEKTTIQQTLVMVHSFTDTARKLVENILRSQGSEKTDA